MYSALVVIQKDSLVDLKLHKEEKPKPPSGTEKVKGLASMMNAGTASFACKINGQKLVDILTSAILQKMKQKATGKQMESQPEESEMNEVRVKSPPMY